MKTLERFVHDTLSDVLGTIPRTRSGKGWFLQYEILIHALVQEIVERLFFEYKNVVRPIRSGNRETLIFGVLQSDRGTRAQSQFDVACMMRSVVCAVIDTARIAVARNHALAKIATAVKANAVKHQWAWVIPHEYAFQGAVSDATSFLLGDDDIRLLLDRERFLHCVTAVLVSTHRVLNNQDRAHLVARALSLAGFDELFQ